MARSRRFRKTNRRTRRHGGNGKRKLDPEERDRLRRLNDKESEVPLVSRRATAHSPPSSAALSRPREERQTRSRS